MVRLSLSLSAIFTQLAQVAPAQIIGGNGSPSSAPYGGSGVYSGSTGSCATGSPTCVLTGQYNSFRTSTNTYEPTLAGLTSSANFSAVTFLQLDTDDYLSSSTHAHNPVLAQPLYVSNVTIGGTAHNILIVVTLNDTVYAFDVTSSSPSSWSVLWKRTADGSVGNANLWPLYQNCTTGPAPQPMTPNFGGNQGVQTLPYYGIVSTPVVDISQSVPVLYTVTGCIPDLTSPNQYNISWYVNALDLTTGLDLITTSNHPSSSTNGKGGFAISSKTGDSIVFRSPHQMQRPSLLLTRVASTSNLYVAFGTGVFEIAPTYPYHGWVVGYSIAYSSGLVSPTLLTSPFDTSASSTSSTTTVFPSTSNAGIPGSPPAYPQLYPSCGGTSCLHGDNWVGTDSTNGGISGGIWSSGKGPSSDSAGNVYVSSGNGPFDCNNPAGTLTTCTDPTAVLNWGESVIKLPAASNANPLTPTDFYTPYVNNYSNDKTLPNNPAPYQFVALNRYDLDFGTPGLVLFNASGTSQTYSVTADKTGYVYVMPTNNLTSSTPGMGRFTTADGGLTSGTYKTQVPFLANRGGISSTVCPSRSTGGQMTSTNCDQIHELPWWNDFLFVWPWNESPRVFKGSYGSNSYSFNTTAIDPCSSGGIGTTACSNSGGTGADFPVAGYPGGIMAVAADKTGTTPKGTLWAVAVPQGSDTETFHYQGQLYSYTITTSGTTPPTGTLTKLFPPLKLGTCASPASPLPLLTWNASPFAEPTLANGNVFVPVYFATNSSSLKISGVLVFGVCPP